MSADSDDGMITRMGDLILHYWCKAGDCSPVDLRCAGFTDHQIEIYQSHAVAYAEAEFARQMQARKAEGIDAAASR